MARDILTVRWTTFAGLLAAAVLYLFPFATANPDRIIVLIPLIVLAAGLLTAGVEAWLRYIVRKTAPSVLSAGLEARGGLLLDYHRRLLDSHSAEAVVESTLQAGCELLAARGASFVPFDEWGHSLAPLVIGRLPADAMLARVDRLGSPAVRQACKTCAAVGASAECVLINQSAGPWQVICAELMESGRAVGAMNFYFDRPRESDLALHLALAQIGLSAGAALESLRRRDREIAALQYLQKDTASQNDVSALLETLLESLVSALEVDLAILWAPPAAYLPGDATALQLSRSRGSIPIEAIPAGALLEGLWQSVESTHGMLSLENVAVGSFNWRAMVAVPLAWHDKNGIGIMLLGTLAGQHFNPRQLLLLQTVAGEAALLLENARLMVQVEYQAVVDERTRLAREIHDGLAQTLAFLKIQAAQMHSYLEQGNLDRLTDTLDASSRTLNDAYLDARQAIDDLRSIPRSNVKDWLADLAADFEARTGLKVDTSELALAGAFTPAVQAQLIRILQEALSNVHKHAEARHVAIAAWQAGGEAIIEVRDDGRGFEPRSISAAARYGLRGMFERAGLLGGEFQIISQPGKGTIVRLSLPAAAPETR